MLTLKDQADWQSVLEHSKSSPVIVFKHSNACPISRAAHERVEAAISSGEITVPIYKLIVQDSREISDLIASETGVIHESPQVIVIQDGQAIFDTSHHDVTAESITSALV